MVNEKGFQSNDIRKIYEISVWGGAVYLGKGVLPECSVSKGVTGKNCSSQIRNGAVGLLVTKEDGCVRVACRNADGFSQDRGRCSTD